MNANELRIDNWVKQGNYFTKIDFRDERIWEDLDLFEPIPLTPQILEKCEGFEKVNRIDLGVLKPCYAYISFCLMMRHNTFFFDWVGGNTKVEYLHELQNLFKYVLKRELVVNL